MTQAVLETRIRQVFVETFEQGGITGLNNHLPRRIAALVEEYIGGLGTEPEKPVRLAKTVETFLVKQERSLARKWSNK